jgi:hypothetical protein
MTRYQPRFLRSFLFTLVLQQVRRLRLRVNAYSRQLGGVKPTSFVAG